ncbi:MAG: MrtC family glutamic-type intramembrane protease [Myxococcota bacterium]
MGEAASPAEEAAPDAEREAREALALALVVTGAVTALSYLAPPAYANLLVAAVFLAGAYWGAWRHPPPTIRWHGLSFGGLAEPEPLDAARIARRLVGATLWALAAAAIFFPPFVIGYRYWWNAEGWSARFPPEAFDLVMTQIVVVAVPEEAFFRGVVQTRLEALSRRKLRVLGAEVGWGLLATSAIFAVGHLLTIVRVERLAVFFPSLVFGWLRARTGGVGAGVLFHAMCNTLSAFLAYGFGLR